MQNQYRVKEFTYSKQTGVDTLLDDNESEERLVVWIVQCASLYELRQFVFPNHF